MQGKKDRGWFFEIGTGGTHLEAPSTVVCALQARVSQQQGHGMLTKTRFVVLNIPCCMCMQ